MQRRTFLRRSGAAGLAVSLGAWQSWSGREASLHADETRVTPEMVQYSTDIEPIVRLIEGTPREKCFEVIVEQLRLGLPYRRFLAALFLAGIRNVNPQPPGFKFHCVFVIHAAHQISLDARVEDRLLPLFWALDYFKVAQQEDVKQGDFVLKPIGNKLPSPERAWSEFHEAMEAWDAPRADYAITALARSCSADEIIGQLWRYGGRDYRNIGHKAIYVASLRRTLETIGWRHAEPALRSLVLGILDFGRDKRVNDYAYEDQSYLANVERAKQATRKLPGNWTKGSGDTAVTLDLLATFRSATMDDSCKAALERLQSGQANAASVWDAAHLWAGELMMRQPGIYGIHTVTSGNALRYAYETAAEPETRLLMLLQGVGWQGQFQKFMSGAGKGLGTERITDLKPVADQSGAMPEAAEILAQVRKDRPKAAELAVHYGARVQSPAPFMTQAYQVLFRKATDAHDFKYPAAIFEDFWHVSPHWRPHMLATATYNLLGTKQPDSPVMERAVEAMKGIG